MNKRDVMVVDRGPKYMPEILISEVDVAVVSEKEYLYVYAYVESASIRESNKLLRELLGVDVIPLIYFPSPKEATAPLTAIGGVSLISGSRICMN